MIRRQEKYSTRTPETPQKNNGAQHLIQKAPMVMSMDSVVTGVSKLNVFSSSSSAKAADTAGVYNMFCCNLPIPDHCEENDDDDTTSTGTCLTMNETVSSSRQSSCQPSPVATPTATLTHNGSMNFDLASRAMVQFPSLQKAAAAACAYARISTPLSQKESSALQQNNNSINCQEDSHRYGNAARSSSNNAKDENDDDDPPLSSQTEYARQQLYRSRRYREQRIAAARGGCCSTTDDEDCYGDDDADDGELLVVDEVEISRGLGGYEEGFGIHDYYHEELPSTILEEDEDKEDDEEIDFAEPSKSRSVEETEEETLTAKEQCTASVCLYCRNGISHRPRLFLVVLFLSLLIVPLSSALSYDNDPDDLSQVSTRHTRNKRHTKVKLDDLDLGGDEWNATEAAELVLGRIGSSVQDRLTTLFKKTKTPECRAKIAEHFGYFINAVGLERSLPFQNVQFKNECPSPPAYDFDHPVPGRHLGMIQNKTYQPPPSSLQNNTVTYYKAPEELRFVYGIMTHKDPQATVRLIEALYEPGHSFVVHTDGKEISQATHSHLKHYAKNKDHVHILDHPHRVRVNWGGFSMVNATLQMLHYTFEHNLEFDKWIHLASTNYPLASNAKIRHTIAKYPVDANLMHIVLKPSRPKQASWHYFVECDDEVHRIYRLPPLQNATHGAELYTSSQWFTLSREFAHYLAYAPTKPDTFVYEFLQYAQHVVVADETFFGTALLHSPYCDKHHNWNFVHLQFDQWENQVPVEQRDPKKCIMPDRSHCGRSPTTITMDYVDLLTLSDDLWARKFLRDHSDVKDVLDEHRGVEQQLYEQERDRERLEDDDYSNSISMPVTVNTSFEGHGVLIVAKATVSSPVPLCLGLGGRGNFVKLTPCFYEGVPETFAEDWETGAVILEETMPHTRWNVGPCTQDGNLKRLSSGEMQMTPGKYSPTGPRCSLTQADGLREGRCLDAHSNDIEPGGKARVFPCVKRWPQFVSFGDGGLAPKGSMHINVPQHIVDRIRTSRPDSPPQESYLCLGVLGRGDKDEEHLVLIEEEEDSDDDSDGEVEEIQYTEEDYDEHGILKLDHYKDDTIVATQCSNTGAVIEWLFVPFIEEDEEPILEDSAVSGPESATAPPPTCSAEGSCFDEYEPDNKEPPDSIA